MKPLNLYVDCSGCCNCCAHCFAGARPPYGDLLSFEKTVEIVEAWKDCLLRQGLRKPFWWLTFLGEPTTHSRFVDLWSYFVRNSARRRDWSIFNTNGWGIARLADVRPMVKSLSRAGVKAYGFALHGDEKTHNRFCARVGAWQDIHVACQRLADARIRVEIHLNRDNLSQLPHISGQASSWVGSSGRVYCSVSNCCPTGNARYETLRPTVEEVQEALAGAVLPSCGARTEGDWVREMMAGPHEPTELFNAYEPAVGMDGDRGMGGLVVTSSLDVMEHFMSRPAVYHGNMAKDGINTVWERISTHVLEPLPSMQELARRYGDTSSRLAHCSLSSVYLKLIHRYWLEEQGIKLALSAPSLFSAHLGTES